MDTVFAFLDKLASLLPLLVMFAPLFAFIIDTAKRLKLPDGSAPIVQAVLNVAGLVILYFLNQEQIAKLPDAIASLLAVAPYVVGLFTALILTPLAHKVLVAFGLGFSYQKG